MSKLRLAGRFTAILILIAVISTSLSGIMTLFITKKQFAGYVDQYSQATAHQWSEIASSYFATHGSLEDIQDIVTDTNQPGMGKNGLRKGANSRLMGNVRRLIIADAQEQIVADSAGTLLGKKANEKVSGLSEFPLVTDENQRIGTLYIASPLGAGISSMENTFISNITTQIIICIIIVAFLALLLGLLLARQITSPLGELSSAIHQLAQGKLGVKVRPHGDQELVSLGRDFNIMAAKLLDQEQNRRRFMSDIAHELRTPLAILRGRLEALQNGSWEDSQQQASVLVDEVIRLTRLVKDLESIGLAESGALQITKALINVNDIVDHLTPLRLAMEEDQIRFEVIIDDRVKQVEADSNRLMQILINLISNAMRHTESGGEIILKIAEVKNELLFSLHDNGAGIPSEHLPNIFDRFYRADESRSRESGGNGLGLAIARSYVEAHGGRIWVESQPGQGTTFFFTIPITDIRSI